MGTKPRGYAIQHISVPVPIQDRWEGCCWKGIQRKNGGLMEVDCWLVRMEWRPPGLSVCLPLVILPSTMKSKRSFLLAPAHPGGPGKGPLTVVVWRGVVLVKWGWRCGWEGNRRTGVALAMHLRINGISTCTSVSVADAKKLSSPPTPF